MDITNAYTYVYFLRKSPYLHHNHVTILDEQL